ncbi:MAG TPA: M4 family metallopeptidase [Terriglobales bacterium]|jgi:Zn-dependent metalloprotease|nr:M4 family metallopeptidase [Terriglobales bacterium]
MRFSRLLMATCAVLAFLSLQRATAAESVSATAERLKQVTGGNISIQFSQGTGAARFVRATNDATIPLSGSYGTLADKAYGFFEEYGSVFGVTAARQQLAVSGVTSDEAGSDVRMAERYGSLPVLNAAVIVHFDPSGNITAVNGTFVPGVKVPSRAAVPPEDASATATSAVAALAGANLQVLKSSTPVLGVTKAGLAQDSPGAQFLAWSITVTGPGIRKFVTVDATRGNIIEIFEGIQDARRRENYNNFEQPDYSLAVRCRFEGDPPSNEPDCDNAYTYSGDTYNFYWNGYRRDSFDNKGTTLRSYVHYFSTICPNAFWNGQFMTYCTAFPHDDVAGHEISHGVTEFSSNLVYAYQPGALNESFSDIFGESIDLMNSSENEAGSRWQIGEGIAPGGLRNMQDPTIFGDPDATSSPNYSCSASDNGGVHINSGVPNKAYALMVDGGTHNGIAVTGIGLTRASAVEYRANTGYLGVYSSFVDDNEALLASCRDLRNKRLRDPDPETGGGYSAAKISKADCAQVQNALNAVKMAGPVCANVAPAPAPAKCSSGTAASLFFDDQEGNTGWTTSLNQSLYTGQQWQIASDFVASGTHAWRANDELSSCSSGDWTSDLYLVSPPVNLAGAMQPVLRFLHDFFTEGGYDGGTVEININGAWMKLESSDFTLNTYNGVMNPDSTAPNWTVTSRQVFTGYRTPGNFPNLAYSESRVNLTRYLAQDADKIVQFRFRFGTDFCNGTEVGWYLDDVEVYECR